MILPPIIYGEMSCRRVLEIFAVVVLGVCAQAETISGVTFANRPGQMFLPLRGTANALGWDVHYDGTTGRIAVRDQFYRESDFHVLFDGTKLLPLKEFVKLGALVQNDPVSGSLKLTFESREVEITEAPKRVEVSIADQTLRAWQGDILVMETNISSGRPGHSTPTGKFKAGPAKSRMHYSRLYDNSPMPYSVQINGNIFIHGYRSVPRRPASHGCIRMPLTKKNAAKYFYEWVDLGTPVWIVQDFTAAQD